MRRSLILAAWAAHCGSKDVPVTLDARGDRLRVTWDRKVEDMKRCN
jgi:hypothetical protein